MVKLIPALPADVTAAINLRIYTMSCFKESETKVILPYEHAEAAMDFITAKGYVITIAHRLAGTTLCELYFKEANNGQANQQGNGGSSGHS